MTDVDISKSNIGNIGTQAANRNIGLLAGPMSIYRSTNDC